MHSLSNISDECLSLILQHDPTSVISLMLCGSSSLKTRIVRTCRTFSTPEGLLLAYKWPRLLAELPHLESVRFEARFMREPLELVANEVKRLPRSLKRLTISLPKSSHILLSKFSTHPHSSEIVAHHVPISSPVSSLWNIAHYFPSLEALDLHHDGKGADFRLRGLDLSVFPATLHTLNLANVHLPLSDFSHLPRELKSLSISSIAPSVSNLMSLPPRLTFLSGVHQMSCDGVKALPKTLTSGINSSELTLTAPFTLEGFPPGLLTFGLGPGLRALYAQNSISLFPKTLTDVSIGNATTCAHIQQLPPTITRIGHFTAVTVLTQLRLYSEARRDAFWPPLLRILELIPKTAFTFPIIQDHIPYLPQTLTSLQNLYLDDSSGTSSVFECASQLPPNLVDLSLYTTPRPLDASSIFGDHEDEGEVEEDDDPGYWENAVSPLPRGLTTLKMIESGDQVLQTEAELGTIPSTLTELELQVIRVSSLGKLPRSLKSLKIASINGDITIDSLKALPKHLESLELTNNWYSKMDFRALQFFPPTLRSLIIYKTSPSALEYIPTSILRLSMEIDYEFSSTFDASKIPFRWLRWLAYNSLPRFLMLLVSQWPAGEPLPSPLQQLVEIYAAHSD